METWPVQLGSQTHREPTVSASWTDETGLGLLRKAVFCPVPVRSKGGTRKVPRVLAYFRQLGIDVAQKKRGAAGERLWFLKRLNRLGKLEAAGDGKVDPVLQMIADHKKLTDFGNVKYGKVLLLMFPEVCAAYRAEKGELIGVESAIPYWLDLKPALDWLRWVQRRSRRSRAGQPYEVGRGKPPKAHRWNKGQCGNPSGRKPKNLWDDFNDILMEELSVMVGPNKVRKLKRLEVEVAQTFAAAMEGDRLARRTVRGYIAMLDDKGLLSPPPTTQKRRRHKRSADPKAVAQSVFLHWLMTRAVKRDLVAIFTNRYGKVPPFTTRLEIEFSRAKLEEHLAELDLPGISVEELSRATELDPDAWTADEDYELDFELQDRQRRAQRRVRRDRESSGPAAVETSSALVD